MDKAFATLKCSRCGQQMPEGSPFCLACGTPLGGPATATSHEGDAKPQDRSRDQQDKPRPESGPTSEAPAKPSRSHRSPLTLALAAMLIGGLALAIYGFVSAVGGDDGAGMSPLAQAGLGSDTREEPPDPGNATTDSIAPGDETQPGSGDGEEPDDGDGGEPDSGGDPPTTGIASPEQALGEAFGHAEGETVASCSTADFDDALCYLPYLTNLEQGRYLYQVGAPFSEPFAWALVEQQGDGTFATTQTAEFDFEGDGTPPFSPGGAMAGATFTNELLDDRPTDRLDDGNSPLPAGTNEVFVSIQYTGLETSAQLATTLQLDGSLIGEPSGHDVHSSGEGWLALRIAQEDGSALLTGTYTVTVLLNGDAIAQASVAVVA